MGNSRYSCLRSLPLHCLSVVVCVLLAACESTTTRSCTWTGPDGKQQSVVAVESQSTKADVASIEALAGVTRSVLAGTAGQVAGLKQAPAAQPAPTLPALCARMFQ